LDANGDYTYNSGDYLQGPFGLSNDQPVVGNWTGVGGFNGTAKIGVFQPSASPNRIFFLDNGNGQFVSAAEEQKQGPFGQDGDLPVRWHISTVKAN
jgi:hypothetical protein